LTKAVFLIVEMVRLGANWINAKAHGKKSKLKNQISKE
jgi:hypothetical protein